MPVISGVTGNKLSHSYIGVKPKKWGKSMRQLNTKFREVSQESDVLCRNRAANNGCTSGFLSMFIQCFIVEAPLDYWLAPFTELRSESGT